MAVNPGAPGVEGFMVAQVRNATGNTLTIGTGVIVTSCLLGSPVAGTPPGIGQIPFEVGLPGGSTTSSGSLGVVYSGDIASGDLGDVLMTGVIAARSDGSGSAFSLLTLDVLGRLKLASSGHEVLAIALATPSGGAVWCRVVTPFVLP